MRGRSVADGKFTQGDVMEAWRRRLGWNGCDSKPDFVDVIGAMTCQTWTAASCQSGKPPSPFLHAGGHEIEPGWVADGFRWMERGGKGR